MFASPPGILPDWRRLDHYRHYDQEDIEYPSMTSAAQLDLLLNSVEKNCAPTEYEQALLPFMFDCADLIKLRLPQLARESLSIAKSFDQGHLDVGALEQAVRTCWEAIGDGPRSLRVDEPQLAGFRAVICILHSQLYFENKQSHPECGEFREVLFKGGMWPESRLRGV